ncbi:hypothetical protein GCM10010406_49410 [Streptomyces thermolineatus]|uniref:Lipoprotein n=1 Tax=Streptomyces thermolineatus TaxID=44033 RepID=A0ABP6A2X4_9ACTN
MSPRPRPRTAPGGRRGRGLPGRRHLGVLLAVLAVPPALAVPAGCGTVGERRSDASGVAQEFARALGAGDGGAACALLAPRTRQEVEQSQESPCEEAVTKEGLPAGGEVRQVVVQGQQAMVVTRSDTLFLSRFSSGWKVVAAGCVPRPSQPYRCRVEGG